MKGSGDEELAKREVEVLRLVAEGYANRGVAGALYLAEGAVKNHLSSILMKLNARDRTSAVLRACMPVFQEGCESHGHVSRETKPCAPTG